MYHHSVLLPALLAVSSLQAEAQKPIHEILKLEEGLFEFHAKDEGCFCTALVSTGPDGVLLVETGSAALMPKPLDEIKRPGRGFPTYAKQVLEADSKSTGASALLKQIETN